MGFSWAESSKALGTHGTMEEAIESLFNDGGGEALLEAGISRGSDNPAFKLALFQTPVQRILSQQPCRRKSATARMENG